MPAGNTRRGRQFTRFDFTCVLGDADIKISKDGRDRCVDNICIGRLWRSLKYEAVYLHEQTDGFVANRVIGEWSYNTVRPQSALGGGTPVEAFRTGRPVDMMDKRFCPLSTSPQAQQQEDNVNRILAA